MHHILTCHSRNVQLLQWSSATSVEPPQDKLDHTHPSQRFIRGALNKSLNNQHCLNQPVYTWFYICMWFQTQQRHPSFPLSMPLLLLPIGQWGWVASVMWIGSVVGTGAGTWTAVWKKYSWKKREKINYSVKVKCVQWIWGHIHVAH